MTEPTYDAVIVGGGPAGATAAADLANNGRTVLLLDKVPAASSPAAAPCPRS